MWGASLVINASTVSNTPQRNTFIDYIAADAAFLYNGIVAVLGLSASATVLVCPLPSTLPCASSYSRVAPLLPTAYELRSQQGCR